MLAVSASSLERNNTPMCSTLPQQPHNGNRYNIRTQTRGTLLSYCTYVQWVPDSDVVVAQNRGALCVWYNIHAPDQVRIPTAKYVKILLVSCGDALRNA